MKKIILLLSLAIFSATFFSSCSSCSSESESESESEPELSDTYAPESESENTVYICDGPYAEAYHNTPDCTGLSNWSGSVLEVTEQEAIDMGRQPCGYCY